MAGMPRCTVEGSGPDGRRVTLILPVSFMPTAAGRSYPVAIVATANDGSIDEFDLTGTLWVGPSNLDSVDDGAR